MHIEDEREVENLELQEAQKEVPDGSSARALVEREYELIGHIQANAEVVIGTAKISVDELFRLSSGSVLELTESVNADVVLMVERKRVAKGRLVAVGEKFGLEITEIL